MPEKGTAYKSGYAAVSGRPNVGKSTLVNRLLGQKVAAVSPRAQTTRRRQLGILTTEHEQVIFIDTPGMHKPIMKLGEYMVAEAAAAYVDADVVVVVVDASQPLTPEDQLLAERLAVLQPAPPMILALNKVDLVPSGNLPAIQTAFQALFPHAQPMPISATTGYHCDSLLDAIVQHLPDGQPFFDAEQVTDFYERDIAADLVREAALIHLREEVPHCISVRIDEYTERGETGAYIAATLFVERESQKGIVIGQGGTMLKKIGAAARQQIEAMSGRKVFLELRVKVEANWRSSPEALRRLGYSQEG
jgi:GTP-binding protein Era